MLCIIASVQGVKGIRFIPIFGNSPTNRPNGDPKGKTLTSLAIKKNLKFIGSHFHTFITHRNKGKPDIAPTNHHFNLFHYHMYPGKSVGSDHIPVIPKVSMQPIRIISQPKKSIKTLNITAYKEQLSSCQFPNLNKIPITIIDTVAENIIKISNNLLMTIAKLLILRPLKHNYEPTPLIKHKLQQYQAAMNNYIVYGVPNLEYLRNLRTALIVVITTHKTNIWVAVVKGAADNYGNPAQFWKTVK